MKTAVRVILYAVYSPVFVLSCVWAIGADAFRVGSDWRDALVDWLDG